MKALIIAGGFGTRLRPLTDAIPKSLVPIANKPFLEHQLELLTRHGVTDVILLTGYLAEHFDAFVERLAGFGMRVEVSTEREPLGTAGAVRSKLEELDGTVLVFNGDVLTGVDLTAMLEQHRARGSLVTVYLRQVPDASQYGVVPLDDDGRVTDWLEKPPPEIGRLGGLINAGVYALEPRALERVPPDTFWQFEQNLFPELLTAGERLDGFPSDSYWLDIGNPERFLQAHRDVMDGRAPVRFGGELIARAGQVGHGRVVPPVIAEQPVLVGPQATLGPYVCIGSEVLVGATATVERSVLMAGARVGVGAVVRDSILGPTARIPVGDRVIGEIRI